MRSGELADRLNVSDSSIRNWSGLYAEFLTPLGAGVKEGATREFSHEDCLTLASVAFLRDQGDSHDEIRDTLRGGWRVGALPDLPPPEVEEARREVRLVPVAEVEKWRDMFALESKERDKVQKALDAAQERIAELEREVGQHEGKEGEIKRLEEQIADLKQQVQFWQERADRKRGLFG
jgi:DNA-binding transcriptional MerR regulator